MRSDESDQRLANYLSHMLEAVDKSFYGCANSTLTEPAQEARALIAELLGGTVRVRQEGEAVYARLEMDSAVDGVGRRCAS